MAGGGGLIQLPALLLVLGGTPVVALLGTNKLASVVGTASAAVTYNRRVQLDRGTAGPMALAAFVGSGAGAAVAASVPQGALRPVVLVSLVVVLGLTLRRPALGEVEQLRLHPRTQRHVALGAGFAIGAYDGAVGPGTGTFLVILLVTVIGQSFLHASATAKAVNTATNLAALLLFGLGGHVLWGLGALMALANLAGAQVGAALAIRQGSRWVRRVFLVVVSLLVLRLGVDVLGGR